MGPRCLPVCACCRVQAVQYTGAKLLQECQIPIKAEAFYIAARVRSPGAAGQATQLALLATPVPCASLQSLWSQQQLGSTAYDTVSPLLPPVCSTRGCQSGSKDLEQPPRPAQHRATNHERRAWGYTAALRSSHALCDWHVHCPKVLSAACKAGTRRAVEHVSWVWAWGTPPPAAPARCAAHPGCRR